MYVSTYSWLPNTSRGWNNSIVWKVPNKSINVGDGINILGGKFTKTDDFSYMQVGGLSTFFAIFS